MQFPDPVSIRKILGDRWNRLKAQIVAIPLRVWLLAFALLLFARCVFAAVPDVISITLTRNPDGSYSPEYRQGNKPPDAPTLECSSPGTDSLVGLQNGAGTYTENVRDDFSGTAAGSCTLAVTAVSGDALGASGVTISGNNLSITRATNGAGVLRVTCTTGSDVVACPSRSWSVVDPPVTDTTAPTVPVNLSTAAGSGNVTLTWDQSMDPFVTETGSGVAEYLIRLNGSALTTVTGADPGLSQELTQAIIGASDGTPSTTQDGPDWSLSFGGAGISGASSQMITRLTPVTGNAYANASLVSVTTAATGSTFGLAAMASTDADAASVFCRWFANAGSPQVRLSARASTGASTSTNLANVAQALPVRVRLERSGDVWTCAYSTDGVTYSTVGQTTVALPATYQFGMFGASSSAGTNATFEIEQFAVAQGTRPSYVHTTSAGGTYTVAAADADNNVSAYSAGVVGTPGGGGDTAGPTNTVAPSGSASGTNTLVFNLGTWSDPSGVATYTPCVASTAGGACVDQTPQASNTYQITGLSASTTRWLEVKATDALGNASGYTSRISATTSPSGAVLDAYDGMNGSYSSIWNSTGGGVGGTTPSGRRSFDTGIKRAGSAASKMIVDESYGNNERTEIRLVGNLALNTDWWLGVSTYLATWSADPSTGGSGAWDIGFQCHGTNEGTARNPNCVLDMVDGRYRFTVRATTTSNTPYTNSQNFDCGPVVTGVWVDWVMNFRWHNPSGAAGYFKVWKDGVLCVDHTGPNWFMGNSLPPYFKMGIYKGWGSDGGTVGPTIRTIWHDEFRLGKGSNGVGFGDVVPR